MKITHENFQQPIEMSSWFIAVQFDMSNEDNPIPVQELNGIVNIVVIDINGDEFGIPLNGYTGGDIDLFIESELDKLS